MSDFASGESFRESRGARDGEVAHGSNVSFSRGLDLCGQATKGAWGMSWHQEAMKGVTDCEKPGEVVE